MNKKYKYKSILATILAVLFAAAALLATLTLFTACTDGGEIVNTTEIVYSNGGTVVEYGEYIYFINGIAEFPRERSADAVNELGSVQKGALYRAKKQPAVYYGINSSEVSKEDAEQFSRTGIDLISEEKDWFDLRNYNILASHVSDPDSPSGEAPEYEILNSETEDHVKVEPIIKKIIGVPSYRYGFCILNDRIYFASPATTLDKEGLYEYDKIEFFCSNLDGSNVVKLYTTTGTAILPKEAVADNESTIGVDETEDEVEGRAMPYAFYFQNNKVNIVTFEHRYKNSEDELKKQLTGAIYNTEVANARVLRTSMVADNVRAAYFPTKETHDANASTNTIYDFVYTMRATSDADVSDFGTVLEMMRPSGEDRVIISRDNTVAGIEGISGGYFYYFNKVQGNTALRYTNLYAQLELSSFEKDNDNNIVKNSDGTYKLKSGGKTFVDEQKKILDDYIAYQNEGRLNPTDPRSVRYDEQYVMPMTDYNSIIIRNVEDNFTSVENIFLYPQKASNPYNVRVIGYSSNAFYSMTSNDSYPLIKGGTFTPLTYYAGGDVTGGRIYGYTNNDEFGFISAEQRDQGGVAGLSTKYSTVNQYPLVLMDAFDIHDKDGNVVDTYMGYYTNYFDNGKADGYMAIIKVGGIYNAKGLYSAPMCHILASEMREIHCMDPDCIDFTHNHADRDGYTPGTSSSDEG